MQFRTKLLTEFPVFNELAEFDELEGKIPDQDARCIAVGHLLKRGDDEVLSYLLKWEGTVYQFPFNGWLECLVGGKW